MFLQGELEVIKEIHNKHIAEKRDAENGDDGGNEVATETSKMKVLMLGLDLPPPPLFKDVMEKNIIPQVCFYSQNLVLHLLFLAIFLESIFLFLI